MKKRFILGGVSIAFLLALLVTASVMAQTWAAPGYKRSIQRHKTSPHTTRVNKVIILSPTAISLKVPKHRNPPTTPTAKAKTTPTVTATRNPQPQPTAAPTSPPAQQPAPTPTPPPASNNTGSGMTAEESNLANQLLIQINQDRAANGLPAYSMNNQLIASAYKHDLQMDQPDCGMSHQCPGEPGLGTRISNEGLNWNACGENVGYASGYGNNWQALLAIHKSMMDEKPPNDGHRRNLLSQSFHRVGVAIYISGNTVWMTEDFAN